jgi:hypothetical protein
MREITRSSVMLSLCLIWSSSGSADKTGDLPTRLGYEGCRLSKPLSLAQAMAKDMGGGNEASRAHPDWDELLAKYQAGDRIYRVDCRNADASHIYAGISLYALVRAGVIIARAAEASRD